jgi:hypothetical protein
MILQKSYQLEKRALDGEDKLIKLALLIFASMSLTDLAIESFIHQDLENESKNFKEWMDHHKKYKVRGSVSRTASPMNIVHRQDTRTVTIPRTENIASILSDLSDLEIDLLFVVITQNQEAFKKQRSVS